MNPFDIAVVIILSYCLIRGLFRGLVKEVSSIVGMLAGLYAAYSYYMLVAQYLSRWISNTAYLNILSFLILFCLVFLTISILGVVIKYLMNITFMGWVDRICGAGFGAVKAILIAAILLVALTAFLPRNAPVIRDSLLAPYVMLVSENMSKIISKDMKRQFSIKVRELEKAWQKQTT